MSTSAKLFAAVEPVSAGMVLRAYQVAAVEAAVKLFEDGARSVLIVMATGTGKTCVLWEVGRRFLPKGRIILVTHLNTLGKQGWEKAVDWLGIEPDVEKADSWAGTGRVIVASRQTLVSGPKHNRRMHRLAPPEFSLVIFDEAHTAMCDSCVEIAQWFAQNPECKFLGVTATPDRADERSLAEMFEKVAFRYEMPDAVVDGNLCPLRSIKVNADGIEWAKLRTVGGDFVDEQLGEEMAKEEVLQQIACAVIELSCGLEPGTLKSLLDIEDVAERQRRLAAMIEGARRLLTLIFLPRVAQCERAKEIIGRWIPDSAELVVGDTPEDERERIFDRYHKRRFQFLLGVGALTTGFDEPDVEMVVVGRPTKSRALYAQVCGRGTRPHSSLAKVLGTLATPEERRAAIAASPKPFVTIVDLTCNCLKHKLVTPVDLLAGGDVEGAVLDRASEIAGNGDVNVDEALEEAKRQVEEEREANRMLAEAEEADREEEEDRRLEAAVQRRLKLVAATNYSTKRVNPFDRYDVGADTDRTRPDGPTERQISSLGKYGVSRATCLAWSGIQAGKILKEYRLKGCTPGQAKALRKLGHNPDQLNFYEAMSILDNAYSQAAGGR